MNPPALVILFSNGMVLALDEKGHQMSAFQGNYASAVSALKLVDLSQCRFEVTKPGRSLQAVTKEQFFNHEQSATPQNSHAVQ